MPALLVSPWLPPQVCATTFDHTSLLRSLRGRWKLGAMGARVAAANDLLGSLTVAPTMRTDTPGRVAGAGAAAAARRLVPPAELTDNQQALLAFSQYLEAQTPGGAPATRARAARAMRGAAEANQVARERARNYLRSLGGKVG